MKTVFFGTPDLAVPFLKELAREHHVGLVVSQPDRASGRGMCVSCCPVKKEALEMGLKLVQPDSPSVIAGELAEISPDIGVVVAYGKLLKKNVLCVPRLGFINIHFSLLPKYRGAAPVPWALMRGETETGVTSFWLDEGMDTGPICLQKRENILSEDDAVTLLNRLVAAGVGLMSETLRGIASGNPPRVPQSGQPSLAPQLTKEDSWLDFNLSAPELHNKVRGLRCWPRARVLCPSGNRNVAVQVLKTLTGEESDKSVPPGAIVRVERGRGFYVKCRYGTLLVEEVQPEGKRPMSGCDFLNGARLRPGDLFAVCPGRNESGA